MKIAVLGTGMVGQALARKCASLNHPTIMGSRTSDNEAALKFSKEAGPHAENGTFEQAARKSELIIVATNGAATLDALKSAGAANLDGRIVVDVTNPLDFSGGFPPVLLPDFAKTSLGETIQKIYPAARVVKALNTVNCNVMVEPTRLSRPGDIFLCGEDTGAKSEVVSLLNSFGWRAPVDLGGISAARGMEAYVLFWVRLMDSAGGPDFNIELVR